jgi:hypothetical protein
MNDDFIDEEELHYITSRRSGTRRCNCFRVILEEKGLRRPQYNMNFCRNCFRVILDEKGLKRPQYTVELTLSHYINKTQKKQHTT